MNKPIVAVSGGFDPIHKGHIEMIREASEYGDVLVILNSDEWLIEKKGYKFMSFDERAYIAGNIKGVTMVTSVDDADGTVCKALVRFKPNYFANGGDRHITNTPEMKVCKELDIEMLWNIGGEKTQSSSTLVEKARYGKRRYDGQEF